MTIGNPRPNPQATGAATRPNSPAQTIISYRGLLRGGSQTEGARMRKHEYTETVKELNIKINLILELLAVLIAKH